MQISVMFIQHTSNFIKRLRDHVMKTRSNLARTRLIRLSYEKKKKTLVYVKFQ